MRYVLPLVAVVLLCALSGQSRATSSDAPKEEPPLMVAMATCKTVACVRHAYAKIRKPDIVARIVYFSRLLALRPGDADAALGLLQNIPRTEDENGQMIILATTMYPDETDAEIEIVGQAFWHYSRNLVHALRLHPEFLPAFIRYGTIALSPHSTYPNWAAKVCRSDPKRFLRAFQALSPKNRAYIAHYVIQPHGCKQIAFPEADSP